MKLRDLSVTDLVRAFASSEPTPGGGSASALAGAVGASLLAMVAGLPKSRAVTEEDAARLSAAGDTCAALSLLLTTMIDLDSQAYDLVVGAFKLPKATDVEKSVRAIAIQTAMHSATAAPLDVMRACADAIEQAAVVAAFGNRNASSDVQVALELLGAGSRGAKVNVETNLASITDAEFVTSASRQVERRAADAERGIAAARMRLTDAS
jgi:methenyltetrahydrofolate cyclohydrolase